MSYYIWQRLQTNKRKAAVDLKKNLSMYINI